MSRFTLQAQRIPANGVELDALLYLPDADAPVPLIVMSPGFAALKEQYLDSFAAHFAAGGFAVVLYDHRSFGASGGELRGDIDPWQQIDDMREVLAWASLLPRVDAARLGVWGSSYSGGHALVLGAVDRRVRCVVAQVPTIDGHQVFLRRAGERIQALREAFQQDRLARYQGEAPRYRRVIAQDGEVGIYPGADAEAFYASAWSLARSWENRVTLRSSERASEYEPGAFVGRIGPTPLLMLVAERDTVTPTDLALAAYERAVQPKRLCLLPDGHFDPYTKHADLAKREALDWFRQHL
ncbi:alpha/beta hydrolase [Azotobacter beijerinckii]|uniref:Xaa-Pro dipeptidyl-peptidase-like domain-containing protein n=1 Tax=Azotobacter beijerinckii TaxID=170623 RepID=A0A1I4EF84_9GAMM|nr:alpha/beta hydrolase [Azotobacter beijerinckii]SFA97329.1 hypothetical protein SAMN04244571_00972 [Azotobacter beijerinckii]SFL03247.1 hypothetical protein SAMN04244574_02855 [Azotobacter beijerinckii]